MIGLEKNGVTLVWKVEVTLLNTPDVTFGGAKDDTLVVRLDVTMEVTLRDDVCDFGLEVNTVEVNENRLERNGVTLVWKVEVTLLNTPDVTFGGEKDDTLVGRLDVTMDVTLRDDVCDFGLEVNTVAVTENRLERNGVALVWKLEVTLFNTVDVTFGDTKDETLVVIRDDIMGVTLRDDVCDSGLKVNTIEVTENCLESNGVTVVWKLEVTLGIKDVTLKVTVDAKLVLFSDDLICVDSTLDECNVKDDGVTLPVESGVTLRVNEVFFNNVERVKIVLLRVNSELFLCVATELVNDTVNLVHVEVFTCVTSKLPVLVFIVIKGVTDEALLSVTMVLRI